MKSMNPALILSSAEADYVARRLHVNITGAALLGVGLMLGWLRPEHAIISEVFQAFAALLVGIGTVWRGIKGLTQKSVSGYSDQLVSIAVIAAAVSGDFVTAALVPLALDIGRLFEERSTLGAQAAIEQMLSLQSQECLKIVGETTVPCSIHELTIGDHVRVRSGELVPGDGVVVSGQSSVDTSSFSGEAAPRLVNEGDYLYAGMTNLDRQIELKITQVGSDAELGKIVSLLREAEGTKIPVQQSVERLLSYYLPLGLCLAATVLFWTEDLSRAVAILVALCPTALALAGPSVMISALTAAARKGCVVKNGVFFEKIASITMLAVDKTGTLTEGRPRITEVVCFNDASKQDVLETAALLSTGSLHPIAQSIVASQISTDRVTDHWEESIGFGISASLDEKNYRLGRLSWVNSEQNNEAEKHRGRTGTWLASDDRLMAFIAVEDMILPAASECIQQLRSQGIAHCIMITGDQEVEANRVATTLGLDAVFSGLLPKEKLEQLQRARVGNSVLMVGDGINDALALQAADVGIAIGEQLSAAALGGADAALFSKDLRVIATLHALGQRVQHHIFQNIALGILAAVLLFILAAMGVLSPLAIALVHSFGVLIVLINAGRLIGGDHDNIKNLDATEKPNDRKDARQA